VAGPHALLPRGSSVQQDWCAWLPAHKAAVFRAYVKHFDCIYGMFSVALNEALELRRTGRFSGSCQVVWVTSDLCTRLAAPLAALLHSLGEHARHCGTIPNVAPLDPANFQGAEGQHAAKMNDLLSRVLLTQRSQFLHKIGALEEMVGGLDKDFRQAAEDLGCGASLHPTADWHLVDSAHFDLNTCLREAIVLLKCFLVALPDEQLASFQKTVGMHMSSAERGAIPKAPPRHRRIPVIERE
jgi:hypothetical protein